MNELMDTINENGLLPSNKRFEYLLSVEEFDEVYCAAMKVYSAFVYKKSDKKKVTNTVQQIKLLLVLLPTKEMLVIVKFNKYRSK